MPPSQHPVSRKELAANRANAAKSTGPRTPNCEARSAQNAREHGFAASTFAVVRLEDLQEVDHLRAGYQPVNSQELFAIERLALTQQALFGDTRLTVSPLVMQQGLCARGGQPPCQGLLRASRLETGLFTTCLNEVLDSSGNPVLLMTKELAGDGDIEITRAQNRIRYQAQAERHYRRAVEEFERLKALRQELPNEPISDAQPEPNETT
jgi:hypothetical protein